MSPDESLPSYSEPARHRQSRLRRSSVGARTRLIRLPKIIVQIGGSGVGVSGLPRRVASFRLLQVSVGGLASGCALPAA